VAQGSAGILPAVVKIALRHDTKGADGGEYSALGAVDLVHAIAVSHWPTLTATWQVEVLREHVARVTIGCMIAFAAPATGAAASVVDVVAVAVI
jgi:hypothetical protein